ncbi:MAG TPA: glycoside hydrolase family 3 C-terminal domain-containing protein [Propionibacteriaceae bacterium]|nr:glycoside hydrolase family 3 C-terminal domain-containing protein [Propionibacteriaceae bacterium]
MRKANEASTSAIDDVIARAVRELDLEDKVRLLTGAAAFSLHGNEGIPLRPMIFSDGPTGVRGSEFVGGKKVALFPNATLLAQAWDEAAAERVGEMLAGEGRSQNVDVVLGPTVNLHRSALGGRLFEAYAEDPLLSGRLAAAYIRGVQRYGIGACVKHYVANESETQRRTVNVRVSEPALRELYLLPFEICVADAHPWTIMAAYNDVNGVAATEQGELNNGVLKSEWGWDGLLMSDWGATKTAAPAANGGLDLVMPGPAGPWGDQLVAAVRSGAVVEAAIDDHLARLLRLAGRVGALQDIPAERRAELGPLLEPGSAQMRLSLRNLAAAGMVLLKGQDVLPLKDFLITDDSPLLLIGRHALDTTLQGGGSAAVRPPHQISIADGLTEALGASRVQVLDGVAVRHNPTAASPESIIDPQTGRPGMRITSFDGSGTELASTSSEVAEFLLGMTSGPHEGASVLELSAELVAPPGTPLLVGVRGIGEWTLSYGDETYAFATALLTGESREVGFMAPPSWTQVVEAAPGRILVARLVISERISLAGLIVQPVAHPDEQLIIEAAQAARDAEPAVVVVGLTAEQETEALDKTTLALPGRQDDLVRAIAVAARRTVVVINSATPVLMPWLHLVDAVLWIGLPGQEGGDAVADVLLGKAEPTGRLVTTFPVADGDGPAWNVTPQDGALDYAEGTHVGYRGWYGSGVEPAFWFGAGLGWGVWDYRSAEQLRGGDEESVTVVLANMAERPSLEVVQVYWLPEGPAPIRLVGYAVADEVVPGEERTVTVACDPRAFRLWNEAASEWDAPSGGTFLIARGLGDIRLEVPRS